ncbi:serine/threonine-protein kinase [Thermophilibacter sp.]
MSDEPTRARSAPPERDAARPRDELLLGRYRVLERRGTGGFGTVCTCWDARLQRRVAIKRMPLAGASPTTAEEALAEARTACMLGHPNIVAVYDFETDGAYAYLVMEYVDGLNLAELLARVEGGRLTPDECAHVVASVGRALAYAHENRVLHLDIKPTNIMIDRQGTVKLADFGMATLASAAGYGDARGGTVGYMPPEQIEGGLVDERTDVFSLAVVVWQALTGTDPFVARNAEESLKRIGRGPGRLSKLCPGLDPGVEPLLAEQLSAAPAPRAADAALLAGELAPLLGDAEAGAASLRDLVGQAEKDDEQDARPLVARPHEPLALRLPEGVVARAVTALAAFSALRIVAPAIAGIPAAVASAGPVVVALACALWTPLAAPAVGLSLAAALASAAAAEAATGGLVLAAAVVLVVGAWWAAVGLRDRLGSLTLLLPCCLPSPVSGAALAGFALDPGPAAATAAVGYVTGTLFRHAAALGFSPAALLPALATDAGDLAFWALLAGSVACAAVSSAVALRGSVAAGIAGQVLGIACLLGSAVLAAGVENGGIWDALDWSAVVLAVLLGVLLCVATVLRGPLYEDQEGMFT